MKTPTGNDAAAMFMALTQGVAAWYAVVPDMKELSGKTVDDEEFYREFRRAELMAATVTVGVGTLGSLIMKEWYPLYASILIISMLVVIYEVSLRAAPPL